jgi:hypothetical protein
MGNPECFALFTKEDLDAIQWDSLEEEMSRWSAVGGSGQEMLAADTSVDDPEQT